LFKSTATGADYSLGTTFQAKTLEKVAGNRLVQEVLGTCIGYLLCDESSTRYVSPPSIPHSVVDFTQVLRFRFDSGNYEKARPFVANVVIDSLKAQRTAKLQGLRMNWKLHKVVEQTVVCAREQEIFKKDEQVGQMAVRFVTEQVSLNPICATC